MRVNVVEAIMFNLSDCLNIVSCIRYAFTRNDDGFEGSHLHALGGILKRTVGFSYDELICRTAGPINTKNVRKEHTCISSITA